MQHRRGPSSAVLAIALAIHLPLLLSGCPRSPLGAEDAGLDGGLDGDAGAHVPNTFDGPIVFHDDRVQALDPSTLPVPAGACREPFLAEVTRSIDGDTVHIRGITAVVDASLRLIGVDTPETGFCYAAEATTFTEQLVGHLIWVVYDQECFDRFDRLLGYVYIGNEEGDFWQRQLLRRGYAVAFHIAPNTTHRDEFDADESFARSQRFGLWSACP